MEITELDVAREIEALHVGGELESHGCGLLSWTARLAHPTDGTSRTVRATWTFKELSFSQTGWKDLVRGAIVELAISAIRHDPCFLFRV